MQKIHPFLWFDTQAEEAANFYVSLFANSKITGVMRNEGIDAGGGVVTVDFEVDGQRLTALNGGPHFKFNEAVSLVVDCDDQAEADRLWAALTADGGQPSQCGWLKDKYGLSWQIIPRGFMQLMQDKDPARARRAAAAMMKMTRLDVAELKRAADAA